MDKNETSRRIEEVGIIPAIRGSTAEEAHFAAEAVSSGGIPVVEITLTVPRAVELIAHLVHYHPKMVVGAGTVISLDLAQRLLTLSVTFIVASVVARLLNESHVCRLRPLRSLNNLEFNFVALF